MGLTDEGMPALTKPVCPVCSASIIYPRPTPPRYVCGHCDHDFDAPVEGCSLSPTGEHDETWMNDGLCECGADGAEAPRLQ